ncbi:hypothetical protein AYY19_08500 [Photobacterium aquimaris]|uniref:dTDP-4-dehydrorhamnose reductase family protein n=1 Tax=Photobacterium aquimaris TaxID=512643 RepID=UPI0007F01BEC|nr:SDR family oxidoreductase [Photobacterium aquimaris]OBU11942.1 hypothetical protein AYY19_08500 [Photobacterium aquimaris]PSW01976.1 SDR family NAD(P)-dependent oxidoreductase [Photobacterium aquimaris]
MENKVLILGTSGMLGFSLYKNIKNCDVYGIQRAASNDNKIYTVSDFFSDELFDIINKISPDIIINCAGVIKQKDISTNIVKTLPINSIFPHLLDEYVRNNKSKLIHFSTDCIFDGKKGMYKDDDIFSAKDIYGLSKYLGEVNSTSTLTLRVSIIGHGLKKNESLIDWFINQNGKKVKGFTEAYFSGLPCKEIANFISNHVVGNNIYGVYNLSANKISKYDLLLKVKQAYKLDIEIEKSNDLVIDRSLDSSKIKKITNYKTKDWDDLINIMKEDYYE